MLRQSCMSNLTRFQTFREIEGATQFNDAGPVKITNCKHFTFDLETAIDVSTTPYTSGGIVEQVKTPVKIAQQPLGALIANPIAPGNNPVPLSHVPVHCCRAHGFVSAHRASPFITSRPLLMVTLADSTAVVS